MPPASEPRAEARAGAGAGDAEVPSPVAGLVGGGLDDVAWRWLGPGVWDHVIPVQGAGKLRLLKVAPEHHIPEHGHGGSELTLVLRGSFHDQTGRYLRGDVSDLDEDVEHQPLIDGDVDCICSGGERGAGAVPRAGGAPVAAPAAVLSRYRISIRRSCASDATRSRGSRKSSPPRSTSL